jgi:16S rRNA (cytosine967-C5)-methyltransferase
MTPAARVADAIILLDKVIAAARDDGAAADTLARQFFATRRYAGSKDRRAIRALVWRALRAFADPPQSGRAAVVALADNDPDLAELFDGLAYGPPPIDASEPRAAMASHLPTALADMMYACIDDAEVEALLTRAPVDIRINRQCPAAFALPDGGMPLPQPLHGHRYPEGTDLMQDSGFIAGAFEVQDAGSQWIAAICGAQAGQRVIDLCAGAGGKALALWSAMDGAGQLLACDSDRRRLEQLRPRAVRAGAEGIESRLVNPPRERDDLIDWRNRADIVLVDAPCSGSGTWRRNPEARWRATPARIERLTVQQSRLLEIGAELVAPGGALIYAVCALTRAEGADVVQDFLAKAKGWTAVDCRAAGLLPEDVGRPSGPGIVLTPAHDGCDGFFFARLQAP